MKTKFFTVLALLVGFAAPGGMAQEQKTQKKSVGVPSALQDKLTIHTDVSYGKSPVQKLDAYILKSDKPTPVFVEIHGGGFRLGAKNQRKIFSETGPYFHALSHGISVVDIDYALSEGGKNPFPAANHDVARAIQFIRSKAKDWNIDPKRIATNGFSAGATLSAWLGVHDDLADPKSEDPVARESTRLTCFVTDSGPHDFARFDLLQKDVHPVLLDAVGSYIGCKPEEYNRTKQSQDRIREASSVTHVSADDPPALIIMHKAEAGMETREIPAIINNPHVFWYGELLARALKNKQAPYEKLVFEKQVDTKKRTLAILNFVGKHLKPEGWSGPYETLQPKPNR
ncbi:MAG: alpha/beta hydrolase [Acidobacteria bacterium]|nr:alpha/beta hydrolase [Acidobacteriota bacterium]